MDKTNKVGLRIGLLTLVFAATTRLLGESVIPSIFNSLPVQIEIPLPDGTHSAFGTGIYLTESNHVFLVTAAHCLFNFQSTNRNELLNTTAITTFRQTNNATSTLTMNLNWLNEHGAIRRHPLHDIAVVFVGPLNTNGQLMTAALGFQWNFSQVILPNFDTGFCRSFTNIPNGCETLIFGFPRELVSGQITAQLDFDIPLIRKGIVSQKNETTKKLIIDSGVFGGNSGGPLVAIDHPGLGVSEFRIAGIMTQFVPVATRTFPQDGFTNSVLVFSGYSVAEPIDLALDLMRQF
jgi:hypothetical protein